MATSGRRRVSRQDSRPRARPLPAVRDPKLYVLSDRPGLYRACGRGEAGAVAVAVDLPRGGRRLLFVRRQAGLESDLAAALRSAVVTDGERFVCDRCGVPCRTLAVVGGRGLCGGCGDQPLPDREVEQGLAEPGGGD